MSSARRFGVFAYLIAVLSACGGDTAPHPTSSYPVGFLDSCHESTNCERGSCQDTHDGPTCTITCSDDAACGAGHFCVSGLCELSCEHAEHDGQTCHDGALIACAEDGSPNCAACGCPRGFTCSYTGACRELARPGTACTEDSECASGFCHDGQCHVGQGQPCAEGGCTACDTWAGEERCAECVISGDSSACILPCTAYPTGDFCLGGSGMFLEQDYCLDGYSCVNHCEKNEDCPLPFQQCVQDPTAPDRKYCSLSGRLEGTTCRYSSDCAGGLACVGDPAVCVPGDLPAGSRCESPEQCASAFCVDHECREKLPVGYGCGQPSQCESGLCLPGCDPGDEGCDAADACPDSASCTICLAANIERGGHCAHDEQCAAGSPTLECLDHACGVEPQSNGGPCLENADCISGCCPYFISCHDASFCEELPPEEE